MAAIIAKVASRISLCKLKCRGVLPQLTWADVGSMVITPNKKWPTHKLAVPFGEDELRVRFDTPIGIICSDASTRHHLGLLIFEELCSIYEQGKVQIRKGDIVLDLGAHLGTFTRFALQRGAAKVIAFEPEPSQIACLKQTFAEELKNGTVQVIEAAAWHHEGSARFTPDGVGSRVTEDGPVSVSLTCVDKVVEELGLSTVDFIKADIEGAERHALAGATETIRRFRPRMAICIYHYVDDPQVIPGLITSIRPYSVCTNAAREQAFFSPVLER
jgi:FkbM family methyltransferase